VVINPRGQGGGPACAEASGPYQEAPNLLALSESDNFHGPAPLGSQCGWIWLMKLREEG